MVAQIRKIQNNYVNAIINGIKSAKEKLAVVRKYQNEIKPMEKDLFSALSDLKVAGCEAKQQGWNSFYYVECSVVSSFNELKTQESLLFNE